MKNLCFIFFFIIINITQSLGHTSLDMHMVEVKYDPTISGGMKRAQYLAYRLQQASFTHNKDHIKNYAKSLWNLISQGRENTQIVMHHGEQIDPATQHTYGIRKSGPTSSENKVLESVFSSLSLALNLLHNDQKFITNFLGGHVNMDHTSRPSAASPKNAHYNGALSRFSKAYNAYIQSDTFAFFADYKKTSIPDYANRNPYTGAITINVHQTRSPLFDYKKPTYRDLCPWIKCVWVFDNQGPRVLSEYYCEKHKSLFSDIIKRNNERDQALTQKDKMSLRH